MLTICKYNDMIKRIMSFILVMIFLACTFNVGIFKSFSKETDALGEEKIISNATIDGDYAEDRILVVFNNESSLQFKTYDSKDFKNVDCKKVVDLSVSESKTVKQSVQRMSSVADRNLSPTDKIYDTSKISNYNQIICLYLNETGKEKVIDAIKTIQQRSDVLYVGPDYKFYDCSLNSLPTPNDPAYAAMQFEVYNKISLPQAWGLVQNINKQAVRVGVLDSGIDESHQDLDSVVNTTISRDFTTGVSLPVNIVEDYYGHGTQMASVIGAESDNEFRMTGVCWNVELISLRVFNQNHITFASQLIMAIDYAMSKSIQLLNFSGRMIQDDPYDDGSIGIVGSEVFPLEMKISNFDGLFVCSAGNDYFSNDENNVYPANYSLDNLLTVGACDNSDNIWFNLQTGKGSNYSAIKVDLFAPGKDICMLNLMQTMLPASRTSPSAAMVTGVAAIMLSVNPNLSGAELKHIIMDTVDEKETLVGKCINGGRLNAYNAVLGALNHNVIITSRNNYTHTGYCNDCGFSGTVEHKWKMDSVSEGTYTVKCEVCQHTVSCYEEPEYLSLGKNFHTVDCPCGVYSFVEEHNFICTSISNQFYHNAVCVDCGYQCLNAHTWVLRFDLYRCLYCNQLSNQTPITPQNLPPLEIGAEITVIVPGEDAEIDLPPVKDEELTE